MVGAVLDRKFVMKQKTSMRNFDEKFSVVSYSIRLQQTAFTDEGMLSTELVNFSNRLTMEINCLAPEILCLQWVSLDYYPILQTTLSGFGYIGCITDCRLDDSCFYGQATFYKAERFEYIAMDDFYLDDLIRKHVNKADIPELINLDRVRKVRSHENALVIHLRCTYTQRELQVINMCCTRDKQQSDLQALQICSVLQELMPCQPERSQKSLILCGDMDFPVDSCPYQILRDGELNSDSFNRLNTSNDSVAPCEAEEMVLQPSEPSTEIESDEMEIAYGGASLVPLAKAYQSGFKHSISSAYVDVMGAEPLCVWRNDSQSLGTGSYVWFDKSKLAVLGVVDMVSRIPESGIPNADFPSDHLSLKAVFSFLPIGGFSSA